MHRSLRTATLIVSAVAVSALLLEGALRVYFRIDNGRWRISQVSQPAAPAASPSAANKLPRMVLSTYYGQVQRPGWEPREDISEERLRELLRLDKTLDWYHYKANNHGFPSPVDYPYAAKGDEFIVGIFGGSVAHSFAMQASTLFSELLSKQNGRKVVVLNFAAGGHKQPQQLTALAYFLSIGQRFDLIINIDGFNEAWVGYWNATNAKVSPAMPFGQLVTEAENYLTGTAARELAAERAMRSELQTDMDRARWAASYYIALARSRWSDRRIAELQSAPSGNRSRSVILQVPDPRAFTEIVNDLADIWVRSSRAMKALADSTGAQYVHVLQPNQYFSTRTFSAEERAIAFDPQYPKFSEIVPPVYRRMIEIAPELRRAGVNFMDATATFDSTPGHIYSDGCCHYTQSGYETLVPAIVGFMVSAAPPSRASP